jgi:hypothetical protein
MTGEITDQIAAAFGVPSAIVGTGPVPSYRSPYRDWVNWRHPLGCAFGCACELYAMWAAMDESPEARQRAFIQQLAENIGLTQWFDVR